MILAIRRKTRGLTPFIVALSGILVLWSTPELIGALFLVLSFGARLLMAMAFLVIQFVALFSFLGRTKTEVILPGDEKEITLADYWGQPELVRLMSEWMEYLQDPDAFEAMGGRMLRGCLLSGPPGTGKTFLAKALSGSCNLPFLSIEGSGFRAMFVGVDIIKMMQFIGKAKRLASDYGACIAFIDEIDAIGASRGGVMEKGGFAQPEQEPRSWVHRVMMGGGLMGGSGALTRLLYELDGVETLGRWEKVRRWWAHKRGKTWMPKRKHVLFMGSTNRPGILDPALVRPGRFDKKVVVDPPDRDGRRAIIEGYLSRIKTEGIDVEALIADTPRWTPAEIMAAITKDSVRFALRAGRDVVHHEDICLALQEAKMGLATPVSSMSEEQRHALAVHEAGHAIAQHFLLKDTRIVHLTIIRTGRAYGYMMPADNIEQYIQALPRLINILRVSVASRQAETLIFGYGFNSVAGDFRRAKHLLDLLYDCGYFGPPVHSKDSSEVRALQLGFWEEQEEYVYKLLEDHRDALERLVARLLEKNSLGTDEILECIEGKPNEKEITGYLPGPEIERGW